MQQMETGGMPGFRISISTAGRNIRRMLLDFFCGLLVQQKGKEQREWGTQGYLSSNGFFNGHGHRSLHKLFHDFLYRNFHCLGNLYLKTTTKAILTKHYTLLRTEPEDRFQINRDFKAKFLMFTKWRTYQCLSFMNYVNFSMLLCTFSNP